jgi:hypothetical protein
MDSKFGSVAADCRYAQWPRLARMNDNVTVFRELEVRNEVKRNIKQGPPRSFYSQDFEIGTVHVYILAQINQIWTGGVAFIQSLIISS